MAEQQLGTIGRIVESTRALTSNKTLYGAYTDIKRINQNKIEPTKKSEGIGTNGGVAGNVAASGGASEATGVASGGASRGSVDVANVTDRGSSGGAQSRTSLEALNRIHSDLGRMNVTVEKISAFTALLARNSMSSLAELSLMNANTTARMNEKEINTQGSVSDSPKPDASGGAKKEGGESFLGSAVGGAAGEIAGRAAGGIARGAGTVLSRGAPLLARGAASLIGSTLTATGAVIGATAIGTMLAVKKAANWILDFPDGPAKDLVLKLIAGKSISWGWTDKYPKIIDISYLKSLPKEQIALLIDSGKFSDADVSRLKSISEEPKTKTPITQDKAKGNSTEPLDEYGATNDIEATEKLKNAGKSEGTFVGGKVVDPNKPLSKQQMALSDASISMGNKLSPDVQASYDLAKNSGTSDLQTPTEEPTANDINVDEINVPTKEKSLNFGVVAIKTLNIQELILPDGTGLFSDEEDKKSFLDDLEEGLSKGWTKVKDTFSSIGDSIGNAFEPHDQGDLRRKKAKSEETPYEKASGKYGSDNDAKTATKMLMDKGWTKEQASGIAANLNAESRFNTKASGDKSKITGVDQAKGIAQWHPDRQKQFEELSGKKIEDASFEEQINFVDWELKNTNKAAGNKIRATKTAAEAAAATEQEYERSAIGLKGGVQRERVENAERYVKMDIGKSEEQVVTTEVPKKNDTGTAYVPYVEPQKTATLEKQQTQSSGNIIADAQAAQSSGNIIADAQSAQSSVKKAPDLAEDNIKRIADHGNKIIPYVEPQKTATLEKQQTQSSGNIIADAQAAQSPVKKAPDLAEDNIKRIADQASKPQAPIVVQAPAAPAQQQKATTAPIMAVRDDSPMILNMQYGNLRV